MPRDDWTPQQILLALKERNIHLPDFVKTEWINIGNFLELERACQILLKSAPLKNDV